MPKKDECHNCQLFSGSLDPTHLFCGTHPFVPAKSPCLDFAQINEECAPFGAAYYGDVLVLQPEHYLSAEERLQILDTLPIFYWGLSKVWDGN
jgi:hypothetical protein